ncbi:regulatory protein, lacI family [Quadrisphaera granulorum]|uniref:Regulatory LacI family protein n=1 Tax=Quadrisphaera granulorum TaxID=317664 RepID=A0A315ZM82_9ACTN|nr:regulatory LacI family protein [Quadrisphaera granulorum]SZE99098.1 regulatory protein, lacI family [Quadrisphaera granulorum]
MTAEERLVQIRRMQAQGKSTRQIAAVIGISQPRVVQILGAARRGPSAVLLVRQARRETTTAAILAAARRGRLTHAEIAEDAGVSRSTVSRVLRAGREGR